MAEWTLADATQIRANLTKEQENEISMLYRRVYLQVRKQMLAIPKDGTTSQQIQKQYLDKLHKQLDEAYKSLGVGLEKQIEKEAKKAAQGVVDDSTEFFSKAGLTIEGAYSFVPKDVINALVTGQVYGGNWSLSGAIWSDIDKKQSDINRIIAEGVAANKSAYDIAKDLETYIDPKAKKEWDWSKVYPGTSKKVDYNAQRLARTMISHAYQQSLERVCKNNPFVDGFIWQSAHSSRVCPICAERDGQFYKKGELPLDHPNGMCTFIASIQGSMNDVADRLANWVQGKSDPELDKWASDLFGNFKFALVSKKYAEKGKAKPKVRQKQKSSKEPKSNIPVSEWSKLRTIQKQAVESLNAELKRFNIPEDQWYLLREHPDSVWGSAYHYVSNSGPYNRTLRGQKLTKTDKNWIAQALSGRTHEQMVSDVIKGIDKAIEDYNIDSPFVVTRTVSRDFAQKKFKIGATFTEKGYTSTTMGEPKDVDMYSFGVKKKGQEAVLPDRIEILVPSGKGIGVPLGQVTPGGDIDKEFLIKHDTEYEIIGRKEDGTWLMIIKG